jgi:uncharacterized protein YegP (UPF0339 family)
MYRFKIYRDRAGEYRWRLRAGNGTIVATSGEGYRTSVEALRAARRVRTNAGSASIELLRPKAKPRLRVVGGRR